MIDHDGELRVKGASLPRATRLSVALKAFVPAALLPMPLLPPKINTTLPTRLPGPAVAAVVDISRASVLHRTNRTQSQSESRSKDASG
jgi:hypothetical protein